TGTTSGSSARRASTCRSAASCARLTDASQYHTSADSPELVRPEALAHSFATAAEILSTLEHNRTFVNLNPKCEPQLGRRGIYRTMGGTDAAVSELAMLWVLNLSDGRHSLLDIAERSGCSFEAIKR